ncbi:NADH-cytochrome b-5 reductase [Delitschia confertaspora ATCC 74209]|uniref:NADH-cytochrome b5 reductase 2 n=1 Tax=Delitschia confertaspora ATCC 74209 TaxID=1513339 RepID=A0A9P4JWK7_9PLEO|nr:NADH-cytochrome b-5 reductase [Delitschia confertaspora ATCC 74209]
MDNNYSLEEVKKHTKKDDIWIVVHNKVYDITKYLEDHPGGIPILLEVGGADATEAFEEIGHSDEAREALNAFYIGDVGADEHAETVEIYRPNFEKVAQVAAIIPKKKQSKSATTSLIKAVLSLGLTGAAGFVAFTGYTKGWNHLLQALTSLNLSARVLNLLPSSYRGSNSSFWVGFGIATTAQMTLTLGLGTYLSTKLDVHQEFTHFPQHRAPASTSTPGPQVQPSAPAKEAVLDPRKYRKFPLSAKTLVSPNVYRFTFALPNKDDVLGLPTGQHIALRADIQGQSVSRSYTPISNNRDLGVIELLVKVYPQGLMTKHLESMNIGDEMEIRGPKGAMQYSRSYAKQIGMIAGGTGITPMYQLIRAICEDPEDTTEVSLLYANNTEADILLGEELEAFAKGNPRFKFEHVLAHPSDEWKGLKGFVNQDMIKEYLHPATDDSKVLLCGPPPMINAMKKNLAGLGWKEPGLVAKATDPVFLF